MKANVSFSPYSNPTIRGDKHKPGLYHQKPAYNPEEHREVYVQSALKSHIVRRLCLKPGSSEPFLDFVDRTRQAEYRNEVARKDMRVASHHLYGIVADQSCRVIPKGRRKSLTGAFVILAPCLT